MIMEDVILEACDEVQLLSKSSSIKVQKKWLTLFATKIYEANGRWRVGEHLWEGFSSGVQPCFLESKAIELYKKQPLDSFYIFDESGKHCFQCKSSTFPELYNTGYDLYLMPESEAWTVVFCHDNVVYFSFADEMCTSRE